MRVQRRLGPPQARNGQNNLEPATNTTRLTVLVLLEEAVECRLGRPLERLVEPYCLAAGLSGLRRSETGQGLRVSQEKSRAAFFEERVNLQLNRVWRAGLPAVAAALRWSHPPAAKPGTSKRRGIPSPARPFLSSRNAFARDLTHQKTRTSTIRHPPSHNGQCSAAYCAL